MTEQVVPKGIDTDLIERGYACSCRVQASKARGSATIVYSEAHNTYALTNHHVIEGNITYKKVWDELLKRDVKKEFTEVVEILFPRLDGMNVAGYNTAQADIILHNKQQDVALLKFRDRAPYPTARWYPREELEAIPHLADLTCIGAALGRHPIVTVGHLNGRQIEIENCEYWMSTAQSIFGNSGGAVFASRANKWHFLGIPSRISVVPMGFSADAVTHMGYFAPLGRIYDWLEDNVYQFLWDPEYTPERCDELREEKRKEQEKHVGGRDED